MKFAKLLHNPGAGDGDHSMEDLASSIESAGFNCSYASTKKVKHMEIDNTVFDFVVLAGGDGTVRKIAHKLLEEDLPIGLLPMGTANNIAKTLGIGGEAGEIIKSWCNSRIKSFDIGKIDGLPEKKIFLEGFGYGLFPKLMDEMKSVKKDAVPEPETRMKIALETLVHIAEKFEPVFCKVVVDGVDFSGKFILVEVMNIRSIGPNLNLAPMADPGDGEFEVVLIGEEQRDAFLNYLSTKIRGNEETPFFKTIKAKYVQLHWQGLAVHVDDENIKLDQPLEINIEMQKGALQFMVPGVQG